MGSHAGVKYAWLGFSIMVWACASNDTSSGPSSNASNASNASSSAGTGAATSSSSSGVAGEGGQGQGGEAQGGSGGFPSILGDGVWLVGWSGGLDHFSWLRFSFLDQVSGSYDLIDAECGACVGFYMCEGSGNFTVDAATQQLSITLPPPCSEVSVLEFQSFMAPSGFFPNALLEAQLLHVTTMSPLMAAQFAATHCDPSFTSCADPFL
jgi:hypothetical protein